MAGVAVPLPPCPEAPCGEVTLGEVNGSLATLVPRPDDAQRRLLDLYRRHRAAALPPIAVPADAVDERAERPRRLASVTIDAPPTPLERALDAVRAAVAGLWGPSPDRSIVDSVVESDGEDDGGSGSDDGADVPPRRLFADADGDDDEPRLADDDNDDDDEGVIKPRDGRRGRRARHRVSRPLVDVAYHPQLTRLAAALTDGTVRLLDTAAQRWEPHALVHEFQRDIMRVLWSPVGGSPLAVVCRRGTLLWRSATAPRSSRQSAWATWLRHDDQPAVRGAAFSPCGRMLVTIGGRRLVVWDVCRGAEGATSLHAPGAPRVARWSPRGDSMLTAGADGSHFTMWCARTWAARRWEVPRPLRDACWSAWRGRTFNFKRWTQSRRPRGRRATRRRGRRRRAHAARRGTARARPASWRPPCAGRRPPTPGT